MKILGIQYLRAAAACLVLVFHACEHYRWDFHVGAAGVDIFFIISGFVMWLTTSGRPVTFRGFMVHRIRRLVPLYWVVTMVMAVFAAVKPQFFYGVAIGAMPVITSLLFIPYYNAVGQAQPVVLQGWTLNIEMLFYLIFALTVSKRPLWRLGAPTLILIALPVIGWCLQPVSAVGVMWTNPLLLELMMGLWVGYAYKRGLLRNGTLGMGLVMLGVAAFAISQYTGASAEKWRFLVYGLPALALVSGFLMIENQRGMFHQPFLLFLGDASYSIYLWHGLATVILGAIALRLHGGGGAMEASVVVILSLLVSLAGYVWVERPMVAALAKKR